MACCCCCWCEPDPELEREGVRREDVRGGTIGSAIKESLDGEVGSVPDPDDSVGRVTIGVVGGAGGNMGDFTSNCDKPGACPAVATKGDDAALRAGLEGSRRSSNDPVSGSNDDSTPLRSLSIPFNEVDDSQA